MRSPCSDTPQPALQRLQRLQSLVNSHSYTACTCLNNQLTGMNVFQHLSWEQPGQSCDIVMASSDKACCMSLHVTQMAAKGSCRTVGQGRIKLTEGDSHKDGHVREDYIPCSPQGCGVHNSGPVGQGASYSTVVTRHRVFTRFPANITSST